MTETPTSTPSSSSACPHCGEPLETGAKFCESCGKPTGAAPAEASPTALVEAAVSRRRPAPPTTSAAGRSAR